jgi:death-on-curing protein
VIRWVRLTREDVVTLHEMILPSPIRDEDLLASAVEKPWAGYMGVELYPGLAEKAAALLLGLARNHPFLDGNKRTALGACDLFLAANGSHLVFDSDEEVAGFVEAVAQGGMEHEDVVAWITAHLEGSS